MQPNREISESSQGQFLNEVDNSSATEIVETDELGRRTYHCPYCSYTSNIPTNVRTHMRYKHTGEHPYSCSFCSRRFVKKQNAERQKIHTGEKPFECHVFTDIAENITEDIAEFLVSEGIVQREFGGVRIFGCSYCLYESSFSNVQRHIRYKHTGEKPYVCSVCQKRFTELGHLKRHVKVHSGEKPFACPICQRRFSEKYTLNKHQKTHTS
ncbi:Zinc finger protein [Armadillidium vulgare]|nr:Zinc finger protein [Armadillidium vulgare]